MSYGPPAPTSVAQGKYFAAGNPDYDEFFVRLYRLQVDLGQAPEAIARTRSGLASSLGLPDKVDGSKIQASLEERARELRSRGLALYVETKGEPPATTTLHANGTQGGDDAALVAALEKTAAELNRTRQRVPGWRKELEELPPRGVVLESGIEAAFVGTSRAHRSDVRDNLADAQKIMGLMGARLKDLEGATADLTRTLEAALPPPAAAPVPEPAAVEPQAKPKPRATRPARPAGAKPPAKPAAPTQTGEAPSPPKPVQGTAKPDFEP